MQEKDFRKIEVQNNFCINVFGYENELVFPIFISEQKFEDSMDLLLLFEDNKSHHVYIKDFNTFMFHKTKNINRKWFCKSFLQCFSSENIMIKHREDCLSINGTQSVDVEELSVLMIDIVSRLLFIEVKMLLMNLLKQFLKNISTAKK